MTEPTMQNIDKTTNCIFCKIQAGTIKATKIWEDDNFFAILDKYPNTKGMTLVISKNHYPSYVFDLSNDIYEKAMSATKKVAKLLDKKLNIQRTAMAMEGMGIDHLHIKLYPLHGLPKNFEPVWNDNKVFLEKYNGYITTLMGPEAKQEDLDKLSKIIKE